MPLQKLNYRPGINREGTNYSNEGGFYDGDKVRFRSGQAEKIGGWTQVSNNQYLGACRNLWIWQALSQANYIGVGTNIKYYIYYGGTYNDITPVTQTDVLSNPFSTGFSTLNGTISATATSLTVTSGTSFPAAGIILIDSEQIYYTTKSTNVLSGLTRGYNGTTAAIHNSGANVRAYTVTVTDGSYNPSVGDYVIFSGATAAGGITVNGEYVVASVPSASTYTISATSAATSAATGGGTVTAQYELPIGLSIATIGTGWGTGGWGRGGWGSAYTSGITYQLRLWTSQNFGQDLVLAPRGGAIYYWQASGGVGTRSVPLSTLTQSQASAVTAATFSSGVSTITVTSAVGIYPGSYIISGSGITAGTYVTSSYVIGSTSVPLSAATTGSSSGNYTFSYSSTAVPTATNQVLTSSIQQFVVALGSNPYLSATFNPMSVRWSDQGNQYQWTPQTTNQSGGFILTNGSYIMCGRATRQETLIWTDSCLYSMQYIGYPYVFGFNVLMDNISIMSPNAAITINNVTYWIGRDKFYRYTGVVETLPSTLRTYVFLDLNVNQAFQVFAGGNAAYNEVWWFYVSNQSLDNSIDKYVIYNYVDDTWSYGTFETVQVASTALVAGKQYVIATLGSSNFQLAGSSENTVGTYFIASGTTTGTGTAWALNGRTAWLQYGLQPYPVAADYNSRLLYHESGVDDVSGSTPQPITSYVQSSDFGIESGDHLGFIWRILPDVNFNGSTSNNPSVTMTLFGRANSGAPPKPSDIDTVTSANNYTIKSEYIIQEFTGQVYTRIRARQMAFNITSNQIGVDWQLGIPRADIKPAGRR